MKLSKIKIKNKKASHSIEFYKDETNGILKAGKLTTEEIIDYRFKHNAKKYIKFNIINLKVKNKKLELDMLDTNKAFKRFYLIKHSENNDFFKTQCHKFATEFKNRIIDNHNDLNTLQEKLDLRLNTINNTYTGALDLFVRYLKSLKNSNDQEVLSINKNNINDLKSLKLEYVDKLWTKIARKDKLDDLFKQFHTSEKTLEQCKEEHEKHLKSIKNKLVKSIKNNKVLYIVSNNSTITPVPKKREIIDSLIKSISSKEELIEYLKDSISALHIDFNIDPRKETKIKNCLEVLKNDLFKDKRFLDDNISLSFDALKQYLKNVETSYKIINKKHTKGYKKQKKVNYEPGNKYLIEVLDTDKINKNIIGIIHNRMTSQAIEAGKILYYYKNGLFKEHEITSDVLTRIKIAETYKKKLINSISISSQSLKNLIIDDMSEKNKQGQIKNINTVLSTDLIGSKFQPSLKNFNDIGSLLDKLKQTTYANGKPKDKLDYFEYIWLHINSIRNSTIHYKSTIESPDKNQKFDDEAINHIQEKIDNIPNIISFKLKHNNVLTWYSKDAISTIMDTLNIDFMEKPSIYPSFTQLINRLSNSLLYSDNLLLDYLNKDNLNTSDISRKNSCKYLLLLTYKHGFQKLYNENSKLIDKIKEFKKHVSVDKTKIAYNDIFEILDNKDINTISLFYQELQKMETKIFNNNSKGKNKKENNYIYSFKLDFWGFLFNQYLQGNTQLFIPNVAESEYSKEIRKYISTKINVNLGDLKDLKLIKWYSLASLLDSKTLSELKQQTYKYISSIDSNWFNFNSKNNNPEVKLYVKVIKILSIILYNNDNFGMSDNDNEENQINKTNFSNYNTKTTEEMIKTFVDQDVSKQDYDQVFTQGHGDNRKFISYHNIDKTKKYMTLKYIEQMLNQKSLNGKISTQDLIDYKKNRDIRDELSENIKVIHLKFLNNDYSANDITNYKQQIEKLYNYTQLSNKVELVNIKKLNHIILEIYSRYLSCLHKIERDAIFINLYLGNNEIVDEGLKNDNKTLLSHIKSKENKYTDTYKHELFLLHLDNKEYTNIRNYISHYNIFNMASPNPNDISNQYEIKSLMELFNNVRLIMTYDRKTLNSLSNVIQNILEKYKINLTLKYENTTNCNLIISKLATEKDIHLKMLDRNKQIAINANNELFIKQLRYLLDKTI